MKIIITIGEDAETIVADNPSLKGESTIKLMTLSEAIKYVKEKGVKEIDAIIVGEAAQSNTAMLSKLSNELQSRTEQQLLHALTDDRQSYLRLRQEGIILKGTISRDG